MRGTKKNVGSSRLSMGHSQAVPLISILSSKAHPMLHQRIRALTTLPRLPRAAIILGCAAALSSCGEVYGPLSLASQLELRMTAVNQVVVLPASQAFVVVAKNVSTRPVAYDPNCYGLAAAVYRDGTRVGGAGYSCPELSQRTAQLAPGDSIVAMLPWFPMTKDAANNPQWMPEGEYMAESQFIGTLGGIRGPRVSFEIRKP